VNDSRKSKLSCSIDSRGAVIARSVGQLVTASMAEGPDFKSREDQDFSPLHVAQTGFGTHSATYSVDKVGIIPGGEAAVA
jgi:hypothetical protein